MSSNHGKLYTTDNCPVLWQYVVPHAEVNGTEYKRGENGEENGVGNRKGRPTGTETDREWREGVQAGARRTTGIGSER